MKRREVMTLLCSAVMWPLAARAQQKAMPVIGYLGAGAPGPSAPFVAAFRQGLGESGYVEGQNVAIEYRYAEGRDDRLPALAADLVGRRVDVIVGTGGGAPRAAKAASQTIPIVFIIGGDPIAAGLVTSLARPGGNVTGVRTCDEIIESIGGKQRTKRIKNMSGRREASSIYCAGD
jgi:putative ABC transport system substrate-binding protein